MEPNHLSSEDRAALAEFRRSLAHDPRTIWTMPEKHAMFAQDLTQDPPAVAYQRMEMYIKNIHDHNFKQRQRFEKALKFKQDLINDAIPEITNAGQRGLSGYLWRLFLASLNGTPLSSLNFFAITSEGLLVELPFATVSRRVFKFRELANNEITLSINPPVYLGWWIGFLQQFSRKVSAPWGEIVIYERGSGREIARAIALWPEQKIREFRAALEALFLSDNQFAGREREPTINDLLSYYRIERWEEEEAWAIDKATVMGAEQTSNQAQGQGNKPVAVDWNELKASREVIKVADYEEKIEALQYDLEQALKVAAEAQTLRKALAGVSALLLVTIVSGVFAFSYLYSYIKKGRV